MTAVLVALMCLALALLVAGMIDLAATPLAQRRIVGSVLDVPTSGSRIEPFDRQFRATRLGRRIEQELALAGITRPPLAVFVAALGSGVLVAVVLWQVFAPAFAVVGAVLGVLLVRAYVRRARERRVEKFVAQMPDLARVIANSVNAGLSINTAIAVAADEVEEPARGELRRVTTSLTFGRSLDSALGEVRDRLPAREVSVLVATLAVSARAGGSLVTSLRTIADTLEDRKETRREVKSVLAQATATSYTTIALGFALLLLVNVMSPGTVERMTQVLVGQIALVFAGVVFTGGFLLIRRMTRFDL